MRYVINDCDERLCEYCMWVIKNKNQIMKHQLYQKTKKKLKDKNIIID